MKISELKTGKTYRHINSYGRPEEDVICVYTTEREVILKCEDGKTVKFNKTECKKYIFEKLPEKPLTVF